MLFFGCGTGRRGVVFEQMFDDAGRGRVTWRELRLSGFRPHQAPLP